MNQKYIPACLARRKDKNSAKVAIVGRLGKHTSLSSALHVLVQEWL